MRTELYRLYDADGLLLYVGISEWAIWRFFHHRKGKHWACRVKTITLEHFDSRSAALAAERDAIRDENPELNVKRQKPWQPEPQPPCDKSSFNPDEWQDEDIREIWLSPIYSQAYKLQRAAQIMGRPIPAHQLHYRYGSWKNPKTS